MRQCVRGPRKIHVIGKWQDLRGERIAALARRQRSSGILEKKRRARASTLMSYDMTSGVLERGMLIRSRARRIPAAATASRDSSPK
jgi:hypothetical protein